MGATSIAMPIPAASAGRMNRMPSGGSTSSSYSQSPAGGATSLPTQSLTSLFAKHDTQPCEVGNCHGSFAPWTSEIYVPSDKSSDTHTWF